MPFPFIPLLAGAGAAYAASKMGRDSGVEDVPLPEWYQDPNYQGTQDFLRPYGQGILEGNIPEYYRSIGSPGGKEFEDFLSLTNRDISQSAAETAAITGRGRGGSLPAVTAQQVGDNSIKLRWADFMRAMQGKQWLFGEGRGITENVRQAGLENQSQRNNFNLGIFDRSLNKAGYLDSYDRQSSQDFGQLLGTIGSGVLGATTNPANPFLGGLSGVLNGASIDDLLKKGGTPSTSSTSGGVPGTSLVGAIGKSGDMNIKDILKSMGYGEG